MHTTFFLRQSLNAVRAQPGFHSGLRRFATSYNSGSGPQISITPTLVLGGQKGPEPADTLRQLDKKSKMNFGFQIVPTQETRIVERFGKFSRILEPGLHFLVPIVDQVKYVHSMKEQMLPVHPQVAWTEDNVQVTINGNVFVKVVDAKKASYNVEQPYSMIFQMAIAEMRSVVGMLKLDDLLNQRESINAKVTTAIKPRTIPWGIDLLGYEIQDIAPQREVLEDLTRQSRAERKRREDVNQSQGEREVQINRAEGAKRAIELSSEGEKLATINNAAAQAEAKLVLARAQAEAIRLVGKALEENPEAARFEVAKEMAAAWKELAKNSPTLLLSQDPSNVNNLVAQAFSTFKMMDKKHACKPENQTVSCPKLKS